MVSSRSTDSGNNNVTFSPKVRYYDSNEWYSLIKGDKDNFLNSHSGRNGWKKASKSGGNSKSEGRADIMGKGSGGPGL